MLYLLSMHILVCSNMRVVFVCFFVFLKRLQKCHSQLKVSAVKVFRSYTEVSTQSPFSIQVQFVTHSTGVALPVQTSYRARTTFPMMPNSTADPPPSFEWQVVCFSPTSC